MSINEVFFNQFGRLRSGWRFSIYLLMFITISIGVLLPLTALLSVLPIGYTQGSFLGYLLPFALSFMVAILVGWLSGRKLEELPFRAQGFWFMKNWWRDLLSGLLIGAASICLAALIAWAFGGLTFQFNDSMGSTPILISLATSLAIFIVGAAFEEAFFRGYPLQTFSRAGLAWFGTIFTSVIFATLHNGNPNANPLSWFNTFLAGLWLAAAYFKTRNLWFPFGIHLTWNWFQGAVLGINVSGLQELTPAPILRAENVGPQWLTGGDYGLEGGIACTIAVAVSTALIWFSPFLKPTAEMLALTSRENPARAEGSDQSEMKI